MRVDVLAGEPQFIDHTAPVYLALPEEARGDYVVRAGPEVTSARSLVQRAAERGVVAITKATDPTRPILVTSYGDHKVARTQGRQAIIRMEHGIGQSFLGSNHESYAGGRFADDIGLFLCPNEHSAERWQSAYPRASVAVVGCPKLDSLPRGDGKAGRTVAVSFHWSGRFSKSDPLIETSGSFDEYRAALTHLAMHYRVLGHGHPRTLYRFAAHYRRAGIPLVSDFADVCRKADLYVCDTNSTIYEFATTGRPVVVVNGAHFRRDVKHGLRFDWGPVTNVGVQCNHPAQLVGAIEEAFRDTPKQQAAREKALDIVYAHRTGAAQLAADAIVGWLGQRKAKAA